MSKSFSENPVFSEIGVRVGWVANLINCNVGFACISLPTEKSKHSNLGQRCCQASCYFFPFAFNSSWNVYIGSALKHVCIKFKEYELTTYLYSGVIWDLADIVKSAGDRS